ncbi:Low molecular weight phosphotyrosine protein phosphatase [uncultured archaeon]|nr:Low molecular weight phosphotyrosine protein phosphatase [uncultured archaeon]
MIKMENNLLFVCTGNTCRSPMAEYLTKAMAIKRGLELRIASRGISASSGGSYTSYSGGSYYGKGSSFMKVSEDTAKAVLELYPDSDVICHEPKQLTFKDLFPKDCLVLTMEESHRETIITEGGLYLPDLEKRVFTIKEFAGLEDKNMNVSDPIGVKAYNQGTVQSTGVNPKFSGFEDPIDFSTEGGIAVATPDEYSDDIQIGGTSKFSISPAYLKCRTDLVRCLEKIFDSPAMNFDTIIQRREKRKIDEEIWDYKDILEDVKNAKKGREIIVRGEILDQIDADPELRKPYLTELISEIREKASLKGLKFKERVFQSYQQGSYQAPISTTKWVPPVKGKKLGPKDKPVDPDFGDTDSFVTD